MSRMSVASAARASTLATVTPTSSPAASASSPPAGRYRTRGAWIRRFPRAQATSDHQRRKTTRPSAVSAGGSVPKSRMSKSPIRSAGCATTISTPGGALTVTS
jgi:hypothetical protein